MTKHLSIVLAFIAAFTCSQSYAQLSAHTAGYTRWCRAPMGDPGPHLGGEPTATGGIPPYHYHWTCITFTPIASLLDNDTIANPQVLTWDWFFRSIDFQLMVTDSVGSIAYDTVRVNASGFGYSTDPCVRVKGASDTVVLAPHIIGGTYGWGPFTYQWVPNLYLSSDTTDYTLCTAPMNMIYTLHITDSLGCTDTPSTPCYILIANAASHVKGNDARISIYPNPLTEHSVINIPATYIGSAIYFYSADGRLVGKQWLQHETTNVAKEVLNALPGLLFYRVVNGRKEPVANGKVVR